MVLILSYMCFVLFIVKYSYADCIFIIKHEIKNNKAKQNCTDQNAEFHKKTFLYSSTSNLQANVWRKKSGTVNTV